LGGLLVARDVLVERYKTQVDQIATSVLNVTNTFHRSGYAADGVTTSVNFFSGTGAADINVNASIVADTTRALLSASSRMGITTNGQIADYLGNLPSLLANNYVQSRPDVSPAVDPNLPVASQGYTTPPSAGGGSFTLNGVTVNWSDADSVYQILDAMNAADPNVQAVFNVTDRMFFMFSSNPINIRDVVGNFTLSNQINNVLTSSIKMNNGFAPLDPRIDYQEPPIFLGGNPAADDMNSPLPGFVQVGLPNQGPNTTAFKVTPSTHGSFTINGTAGGRTITWTEKDSLAYVLSQINGVYAALGTTITAYFEQIPSNRAYQTVTLYSGANPRPIQIVDNIGNFTVFTGLNANAPIGNLSSGLLNQVDTEVTSQQLTYNQARASLEQLNTAQANIGALSTVAGEPGVPIQVEQENAIKSLIAFNAALQVLGVINQMYSDLVNIVGVGNSSNFLQERV